MGRSPIVGSRLAIDSEILKVRKGPAMRYRLGIDLDTCNIPNPEISQSLWAENCMFGTSGE